MPSPSNNEVKFSEQDYSLLRYTELKLLLDKAHDFIEMQGGQTLDKIKSIGSLRAKIQEAEGNIREGIEIPGELQPAELEKGIRKFIYSMSLERLSVGLVGLVKKYNELLRLIKQANIFLYSKYSKNRINLSTQFAGFTELAFTDNLQHRRQFFVKKMHDVSEKLKALKKETENIFLPTKITQRISSVNDVIEELASDLLCLKSIVAADPNLIEEKDFSSIVDALTMTITDVDYLLSQVNYQGKSNA